MPLTRAPGLSLAQVLACPAVLPTRPDPLLPALIPRLHPSVLASDQVPPSLGHLITHFALYSVPSLEFSTTPTQHRVRDLAHMRIWPGAPAGGRVTTRGECKARVSAWQPFLRVLMASLHLARLSLAAPCTFVHLVFILLFYSVASQEKPS